MLESIKTELFKEESFKNWHWNVFKKHIDIVEFNKNDIISAIGETEQYLYFIIEGGVRVYYDHPDKEINLFFRFEREFISAYTSFLTQTPSKQCIAALEDTKLIRMSYESSKKLMKYRVGERVFRKNAEELFILKERREESLLLETPDERYLNLLKNNKDWFQRIPQHYIASYLGLTPETLSRIKKRNL